MLVLVSVLWTTTLVSAYTPASAVTAAATAGWLIIHDDYD